MVRELFEISLRGTLRKVKKSKADIRHPNTTFSNGLALTQTSLLIDMPIALTLYFMCMQIWRWDQRQLLVAFYIQYAKTS